MENRKKEKITLMSMCIKNENEFDDKTCQNLAKLSCKFLLTAKYCSLGRLQEIKSSGAALSRVDGKYNWK